MKTKIRFLTLLLCFAASLSSFAQFGSNTYGGQTDPSQIVGGRYANTSAYFDSTGTLRGGTGGTCANCPAVIGTFVKHVTLTTAQIEALYSTPDTIISAAGSNYTISVLSAYGSINYNSSTYAADSVFVLNIGSANVAENNGVLRSTSSTTGAFEVNPPSTGIPANQGVTITTLHANPTTGNSLITITVVYNLLNLGSGGDD